MGSSPSVPAPSAAQTQLQQEQTQLMRMQQRQMKETARLQEYERRKIMEQESVQAAEEANLRSRYRRGTGAESLVSAPGQGGFLLGTTPRDDGSGVARTYTPPPSPMSNTGIGGAGTSIEDRLVYSYRGQMYPNQAAAEARRAAEISEQALDQTVGSYGQPPPVTAMPRGWHRRRGDIV